MATRKLDKEHLEQIQTLQQGYAENANVLGNIAIERYALQQRLAQNETEEQKGEKRFLIRKKKIKGKLSKTSQMNDQHSYCLEIPFRHIMWTLWSYL